MNSSEDLIATLEDVNAMWRGRMNKESGVGPDLQTTENLSEETDAINTIHICEQLLLELDDWQTKSDI